MVDVNYLQQKKQAMISMHHSNISSEYEQVEYLESTGTQYIDTEICAQSGLNITIDSEFTSSKGYMTIFGGWDSNSSNRCHLYHHTGREMYYYYAASGYPYYESTDYRNRHTYKINDNILSVDGVTKIINTATSFTSTYNMYIFANNNAGTAVNNAYMRLYAFSISKDDNVLRDFVPALDNNGTPCLYDTITKKYYYNQGTGEFKYGDIITENNEINISINYDDFGNKRINDTFAKNLNLQIINFKDKTVTREEFYNYIKIEYLESTGTQWIDTSIIPTNHEVIATYQYTKAYNNTAIFGANAYSGADCYQLTWYDNKWHYACGGEQANTIDSNNNFVCTNKQTIDFNNSNNAIVWNDENDNDYSATANINGTTTATQTLKIFGRSNTSNLSLAKLYSFKIIDKETQQVIRNFIPVKDALGTPCLYDTVTKKYYYNQGTDKFITGPIVIDSSKINNGVLKINLYQNSMNSKSINDLFATYQELEQINFKDTQLTREEFYIYTKVEYLRTAKTQFLDTKIKYNDNYKIGIDFLVEDTDVNDSVICGSNDWNGNRNIVTIESGYLLRNYYPSNPVDYSFGNNQRKQIEIFRGQIIYDNTVQVGDDNINPSAEANAANIHIFSDNDGGHLINYAKLYGFYIYDTTTNNYIMNAFPVLDNNGTACLYDAVTKKYYYNQGTGEFLYGEVIN